MSKAKKAIFLSAALIFAALLIAPIAALYFISQNEISSLSMQEEIVIQEVSYGEPKPVFFGSIKNSIVASGTVVSRDIDFIELGEIQDADKIRFVVQIGDYVNSDTVIGYLDGQSITSGKEGVIREINYGSNGYILLDLIEPLALECYVDVKKAAELSVGDVLTDDAGNSYVIIEIDRAAMYGNIRVLLALDRDDCIYGTEIESLELYTGEGIENILMISRDCVYSYPGSDKQYVRVVDKDLFFVNEIEVKTWLSDDSYITVSGEGVEEGMLCDSGYKLIAEGGSRYE